MHSFSSTSHYQRLADIAKRLEMKASQVDALQVTSKSGVYMRRQQATSVISTSHLASMPSWVSNLWKILQGTGTHDVFPDAFDQSSAHFWASAPPEEWLLL